MSKKLRINVGDVFTFSMPEVDRIGTGQVIDKTKSAIHVAMFDYSAPNADSFDPDAAVDSAVLGLSPTMDGRLFHGMWAMVANRKPRASLPYQAFKEAMFGPDANYVQHEVINWNGQKRRVATEYESVALPDRYSLSPMVLENLVRSKHGLETWDERWTKVRPDAATSLATIFPEALPGH